MNTTARFFNILLRVCGTGAMALGLAFWLGHARSLTQLHMAFGFGLVASLWALAAIAWRNEARNGLARFAAAWGLVMWVFGVIHGQILPGSFHWVVQVAHLVVGGIAIAVGGLLARAVAQTRIAPSTSA